MRFNIVFFWQNFVLIVGNIRYLRRGTWYLANFACSWLSLQPELSFQRELSENYSTYFFLSNDTHIEAKLALFSDIQGKTSKPEIFEVSVLMDQISNIGINVPLESYQWVEHNCNNSRWIRRPGCKVMNYKACFHLEGGTRLLFSPTFSNVSEFF